MAYLNLDKTYTLRQILWRTVLVLAVLSVLYFCLLVRRDWNVTMGGVGVGNTPYKDVIPAQCQNVGGHKGHGSDEILARRGFRAFEHRSFLWRIEHFASEVDCSGYRLLTGLHGDYWASYRIIFTGSDGQPIAIETVEYHTESQPRNHTRQR
jgi:hypothetical protein